MKELIFEVLNEMAEELSIAQLKKLREVLLKRFQDMELRISVIREFTINPYFLNSAVSTLQSHSDNVAALALMS